MSYWLLNWKCCLWRSTHWCSGLWGRSQLCDGPGSRNWGCVPSLPHDFRCPSSWWDLWSAWCWGLLSRGSLIVIPGCLLKVAFDTICLPLRPKKSTFHMLISWFRLYLSTQGTRLIILYNVEAAEARAQFSLHSRLSANLGKATAKSAN